MYETSSFINIFSEDQWQALNSTVAEMVSCSNSIIETVKCGDSRHEPVDLDVIRIMNQTKGNLPAVEPFKENLLNLFKIAKFTEKVVEKTSINKIQLKRLQLNIMKTNSFIGLHTDSEHDDRYKITAIIRLVSDFKGGELLISHKDGEIKIKQKSNSVFLLSSGIEHEVLPVISGYRNSLIAVFG